MPTNNIENIETTKITEGIQIDSIGGFIETASDFSIRLIGAIGAIILLLICAKIISRIVKKSIIKHSTADFDNANKIGNLVRDLVYYVIVMFSFFIGFEILGFDVGLLLGGVSFGIGLAFKEILGNMFAGIMILYTKEFRIGDIVEVVSDQNYFGRIEEITIRYTIIRTLDLRQVVLPNITLISVPIKTFSSEDLVKLISNIGIDYKSDVQKAINIIVKTINQFDFIKQKESTKVFVTNFGDSKINLMCMYYYNPKSGILADYATGFINEKIFQALKENNIQIPYQKATVSFETLQEQEKIYSKLNNLDSNKS